MTEKVSEYKDEKLNRNNDGPGSDAPVYARSRKVELDDKILLKNRCIGLFADTPELSCYRFLRTQIVQRCKANDWNVIMITSALPGEGKTLTAINLASTFAKSYGQTALLIDCDFQRQKVHQYLGISSPKGLADHLRNGIPLENVIIWPGVEKLTIISGGVTVPDSVELISSPKMVRLVKELKSRFTDRYIFFDLPPLLAEPDALAFVPLADCILMVSHPQTSFDEIKKSMEMIPPEKFLGFVLNQVDDINDGYYRYSYGYRK